MVLWERITFGLSNANLIDPIVKGHSVGRLGESGHTSDGLPPMLAHPLALTLAVWANNHVSSAKQKKRSIQFIIFMFFEWVEYRFNDADPRIKTIAHHELSHWPSEPITTSAVLSRWKTDKSFICFLIQWNLNWCVRPLILAIVMYW